MASVKPLECEFSEKESKMTFMWPLAVQAAPGGHYTPPPILSGVHLDSKQNLLGILLAGDPAKFAFLVLTWSEHQQ